MAYPHFQAFAPAIIKSYRQDKEAFWAAVMAPFLSDNKIAVLWEHRQINLSLYNAFSGLDSDGKRVLKDISAKWGLDVSGWKSNRSQYFKDAYPVFAFLAVWMDEMGLTNLLDKFDEILRAGVYAVAGYGILDENVDGDTPTPVEILAAQSLIAEYESLALSIFGVSETNLHILHRMRTYFLDAEIKEKASRGTVSPYSLDQPQDLGTRGANALAPFMLSLEQAGKGNLVDNYCQVFLSFGAVIQFIDDWMDLEKDLAAGHFSYLTLLPGQLTDYHDARQAARVLRQDLARIQATYEISKRLIYKSRSILDRLMDPCLGRFVDVTDLRLEQYFHKELHYLRPVNT